MTEASKQWVSQIVDGTFPLRQYLGGSDHSAVYLTEYGEGEPKKAAIKLIPADATTTDAQLARWEKASQLSHPNLLKLINAGRCNLGGNDLLYLVMEFAEEDLSQILPQRSLLPEEMREVLCAALDALEYLHGKGFVHDGLKPTNILASGDILKLSSDSILRDGESRDPAKRGTAYDAPEAISGVATPTGDVWSLGNTLVEVLTQRLPEWQPGPHHEPVVSATIPAPYQEIARQCLRVEPRRRISVADMAARMSSRTAVVQLAAPTPAPPMAAVSATVPTPAPAIGTKVGPTAVGPVAIKPSSSAHLPPKAAARLQGSPHRPEPYRDPHVRSRFMIPLVVGALVLAAIVTVPRLLTHQSEAKSAASVAPTNPSSSTSAQKTAATGASSKHKTDADRSQASGDPKKSIAVAAPSKTERNAPAVAPDSLKTASEKEPAPKPAAAPAPPSALAPKPTAGMTSTKGEVLDQVLPDVSSKARNTIRGKVRVGIKVTVDASGTVSGAELDSAGPSAFFADLALKAARKWAFTAPEVNGKSVPSEWRLKFEFTQADTKVIPTQTNP